MLKSNASIKFYLFHILLASVLVYCWVAVAFSYFDYASRYNAMTVSGHLKMIYNYGSVFRAFFDPLLTFTLPPLTLAIYGCLRKKMYFPAHIFLAVLTAIALLQMDWFTIKEPTGKIFLFSYLGLLEYSLRILVVFLFQGVIVYKTRKALNY